MWLLVFRNGQTSFCTDFGDAFWCICKCKCDENMFWCRNSHKTYSIVLMYICFFVVLYYNGSLQCTVKAQDMVLVNAECLFFSKMEAKSNECPEPEALSLQLPSIDYVLVYQTCFYVWGLKSHRALVLYLHSCSSKSYIRFGFDWSLLNSFSVVIEMDEGPENIALSKNVFTQYCKMPESLLIFVLWQIMLLHVFLFFYPHTVFIFPQVGIAILIMLLQRHNVANMQC